MTGSAGVLPEVVEGCSEAVAYTAGSMAQTLDIAGTEAACTADKLIFQTVNPQLVIYRTADAVHIAGGFAMRGDQCTGSDLRQVNDRFLARIVVDIAKIDIIDLAGGHLAQLLLDATAALNGISQQRTDVLFAHALVRVNQLGQA